MVQILSMLKDPLKIVPVSFKQACEFVKHNHRHHQPPQGHKFSIGLMRNNKLVGVAMIGRPVARMLDDGYTTEVTRLCVIEDVKNACSKLYAASWRAAKAIGYERLVTYILESEKGTSLKAAGWSCVGKCGGGSWSRKNRQRADKHPTEPKIRYEQNTKQRLNNADPLDA